MSRKLVVMHVFKGGRFEGSALPVGGLADLVTYSYLLVETAKDLWRAEHPDRKRLPPHFEERLGLVVPEIKPGFSIATPLMREETAGEQADLFTGLLDDAADLIASAIDSAEYGRPLPSRFPKRLLPGFDSYGKDLAEGEWFEHRSERRQQPAKYTPKVRERFRSWAVEKFETTVDLVGIVTMARWSQPKLALALPDGSEIEATFEPSQEETVTTALKDHSRAQVRIQGKGLMSPSGEIDRITHVDRLTLVRDGESPVDRSAKPIWEVFEEATRGIAPEEFKKLPEDGATDLDRYLYGSGG